MVEFELYAKRTNRSVKENQHRYELYASCSYSYTYTDCQSDLNYTNYFLYNWNCIKYDDDDDFKRMNDRCAHAQPQQWMWVEPRKEGFLLILQTPNDHSSSYFHNHIIHWFNHMINTCYVTKTKQGTCACCYLYLIYNEGISFIVSVWLDCM